MVSLATVIAIGFALIFFVLLRDSFSYSGESKLDVKRDYNTDIARASELINSDLVPCANVHTNVLKFFYEESIRSKCVFNEKLAVDIDKDRLMDYAAFGTYSAERMQRLSDLLDKRERK